MIGYAVAYIKVSKISFFLLNCEALLYNEPGHVYHRIHLHGDGRIWIKFYETAVVIMYQRFQIATLLLWDPVSEQNVHNIYKTKKVLPMFIALGDLMPNDEGQKPAHSPHLHCYNQPRAEGKGCD